MPVPRLRTHPPALLAAALLLVCLCLLLVLGPTPYTAQVLSWQSDSGEALQARLWLPRTATGGGQEPLQGVLLVHGVASNAQQLEPAARALAASGQAVLTLSLHGSEAAQLQQVLSAVQLLRSQPRIQAVALIGHSRGARLAAEAALLAGELEPVIAVGARPEGLPVDAVLTGLYDSLHPPWRLPAGPETQVSPSASHQSAWHDLHLLKGLNRLLHTEAGPLWRESLRLWVQVLLALSLLGLGASQYPLRPGAYPGVVWLSGLSGWLLLAGYLDWLQPAAAALALLVLWGVYLLGQLPVPLWQYPLIRLLALLLLLREGGALLRALLWDPAAVIWWPLALWQNLLVYPLLLQRHLVGLLFGPELVPLQPAWPLLVLLGAEILFPAWWRRAPAESGARSRTPDGLPQSSRLKSLSVLLILATLLAGLLFWRLGQGYLSPEALWRLTETLALEIIPAAVLAALILLWRRAWRQRAKKECPRDDSNVRPTV